MKKYTLIITLMLLVNACSFNDGRVQLLGNNLWGGAVTPASVVVRKGDTLYSIARGYDIPLRDVIELNHLTPPYVLKVGQRLRLPTAKYHIVSKGDTLYNISKRYNVDINSLSKTNHICPPYSISVGQRLLLPGTIVDDDDEVQVASLQKNVSSSRWKSTKTASKNTKSNNKTYRRPSSSYTPPPANRKSKFVWPVNGKIISNYGPIAKGRNNDGINIKAAKGTTVRAADKGVVAYAGNELKGFGNLILIKHDDGWVTAYAHNDKIVVKKGQRVARGEKISTVGATGGVATPQLHFEIRRGKKAVNPKAYLG